MLAATLTGWITLTVWLYMHATEGSFLVKLLLSSVLSTATIFIPAGLVILFKGLVPEALHNLKIWLYDR